jgi:hypothetical protein
MCNKREDEQEMYNGLETVKVGCYERDEKVPYNGIYLL